MSNPLYDRLFGIHEGSDRTFLLLPVGRRIGFGGFLGMAHRFAHQIVAMGLKPGDRLAVQIAKSPEALAWTEGAAAYRSEMAAARAKPKRKHILTEDGEQLDVVVDETPTPRERQQR
jgi:hypothetical protein